MTSRTHKNERRAGQLSKDRIVDSAIAILDAEGEGALTFRVLAARLATGAGAIYWHVADKQDLLAAATDHVIGEAFAVVAGRSDPRATIRAIASAVFDAIDRRPWVGAQLSRNPLQDAGLRIFERVGEQIEAFGVPEPAQFNAATAILSLILGLAGQYASALDHVSTGIGRTAFLESVAARWAVLDPDLYPFVRRIAAQLSGHDDRAQFLAGIDLILAGIAAGGKGGAFERG
jgi:AcrR family transcriptional regulator